MKAVRNFKDFLEKGSIRKHFPDETRAKDLLENSNRTFNAIREIINKIGLTELNLNTIIKESYDSIMEAVRAKMLSKGFSATGFGAHEAEVSYLKKLNFSEADVDFMNKLRYFRNGIVYYGKKFDKEYAQKVLDFLIKTKKKLK